MSTIAQAVSCIDGYDPDALRVDKALAAIRACLAPVTQAERVPVRALRAAGRGLIASVGIGELGVKGRLRVAFFSAGDEPASTGTPLKTGEVYDSNRYPLHGMLQGLGVEIVDLGVVRDDPAALERAFLKASTHDAIITTGGVSV